MENLRRLLATGLVSTLGFADVHTARAADLTMDTRYTNLTHGETLQSLAKKSEKVTYQSFDEKIKRYDGAVLMLATSTCPTAEAELLNRNQEIVHTQLIDKYADSNVNGLPIKFTWFDICGRSGATDLGIKGLETQMYLDGKLIDRAYGGPLDEETIKSRVKNMTYWINYNLLGITEPGAENIDLFYKGGKQLMEFPRRVLEQ